MQGTLYNVKLFREYDELKNQSLSNFNLNLQMPATSAQTERKMPKNTLIDALKAEFEASTS